MVDIARLYHPAYSNDPRILAWCAALPEVSDCSSASVTPARAQWCCRSRVKAQIDPRVLLADAASRDHCPARRVGQSALLRRLLDLPTVGIPQRPLARRRLVASRQPWALSVLPIRNGSSRTGCGPEQAPIRTSSTPAGGRTCPPQWNSSWPPPHTAAHPSTLRGARHSARTARQEASADDRTR